MTSAPVNARIVHALPAVSAAGLWGAAAALTFVTADSSGLLLAAAASPLLAATIGVRSYLGYLAAVGAACVAGATAGTPLWVCAAVTVVTAAMIPYTAVTRTGTRSAAAAHLDPLTGLLNRNGLHSVTAQLMRQAGAHSTTIAAAFCDVDGLKHVNDTHGHEAGDAVITAVAQALRGNLRASDVICRWGGDEFVVVSAGSGLHPTVLTERLTAWLVKHPPVPDSWWHPSVTVGYCAALANESVTVTDLINNADADMYTRRSQRGRQEQLLAHARRIEHGYAQPSRVQDGTCDD